MAGQRVVQEVPSGAAGERGGRLVLPQVSLGLRSPGPFPPPESLCPALRVAVPGPPRAAGRESLGRAAGAAVTKGGRGPPRVARPGGLGGPAAGAAAGSWRSRLAPGAGAAFPSRGG